MANSRFQKGTGAYRCWCCNKLTRDTGYGEVELDECKQCYVEGGLQNHHSDYGHETIQYEDGVKCPTCPEVA
jgi:hypothetical protein